MKDNQKLENTNSQKKNNKKRKFISPRVSTLGLIVLFLIGVGITAYPYLSDQIAKYNSIQAIQEYKKYTTSLSDKELKKEWEKARIYNDHLAGDPVRDPFVPQSGMALPKNYQNVLNVKNDGIMGFLEIPSVDIELLIAHGASEDVLSKYAGHIEQTALPIGGESTHSVLTAHTGLPSARLFTDLVKVKEGDRFYVYVLDKKLTYQVDQIDVILPEDIDKLRMEPDKDYMTLLTCTPYGVNSHRLLVRGVRVPNDDTVEVITDHTTAIPSVLLVILIILVLLIIIIIYRFIRRKNRNLE